jgi:hypothetical protein
LSLFLSSPFPPVWKCCSELEVARAGSLYTSKRQLADPYLTSRNSIFETPGEKPGGSREAPRRGPPWNHLVSLRVSRKRSYGRLNSGDEMSCLFSFFPAVTAEEQERRSAGAQESRSCAGAQESRSRAEEQEQRFYLILQERNPVTRVTKSHI